MWAHLEPVTACSGVMAQLLESSVRACAWELNCWFYEHASSTSLGNIKLQNSTSLMIIEVK